MYGYTKEDDFYRGAFDHTISEAEYEQLHTILKNLPSEQNEKKTFIVYFTIGDLLVTEGVVDKDLGKAKLFGFNIETKEWQELKVDFGIESVVKDIRCGSMVLDEEGNFLGLAKTIGDKK